MASDKSTAKYTSHDASKYPLTFADRSGERKARLDDRLQAARGLAQRAAHLLRQSFEATRVVLFGSLTDPNRFTEWSDIDLGTWGIPPHRYYAAVAAVTSLSTEFKIDLIDVEICPASLRRIIEMEGVEL